MRYLLRFAYLGTRYSGSQRQSSRPGTEHWTVQGAIEAALCQLGCLGDPVVVPASRTDAGVHATENAAHVDLRPKNLCQSFQPELLAAGLNILLARHSHDILVRDVLQVPEWFHARYLAQWRTYRYRVAVLKKAALLKHKRCADSIRAFLPLAELNRCHVVPALELDRAHEVMELLSGEHDFRSFKGSSRSDQDEVRSTVRDVTDFRLLPAAQPADNDPLYDQLDLWEFRICSRSFLYRQVRRMVSVVLHAASPHVPGADCLALVRSLLANPSKEAWPGGVRVVPACGLYLAQVHYDPAHLIGDAEMPEDVAEFYRTKPVAAIENEDENRDEGDDYRSEQALS
uniref:tRNA pseudouridine synthase n=1 Tax=Amblyomma triste TaxID=251400 RepID=A0A023GIU6_AMBTT